MGHRKKNHETVSAKGRSCQKKEGEELREERGAKEGARGFRGWSLTEERDEIANYVSPNLRKK